eukprot:TRINITY_DN16401_c0_g1_i1.p1 TRINITY_DN16401_c0_g1~~TRINITY_DN16401_c0_g1_i1.p1  ORF type:complete len:790 (+),score=215.04 TRINITY_DN16401_c0_g1_i1:57-2426(+)
MGACCAHLAFLSYRDGDTEEQIALKRLATPAYLVVCLLLVLCLALSLPIDGVGDVGFMIGAAVALVALCVSLTTSADPSKLAVFVVAAGTVAVVLVDWEFSSVVGARIWPVVVVLLDVALLAKVPHEVTFGALCIVIQFLGVERLEASLNFGMYDAAHFGDGTQTVEVCNCAAPPCSIPPAHATGSFIGFMFTAITDFYFTRGFAIRMAKQMDIVRTSVEVAEQITDLLASYDVETAEQYTEAAQLPEGLRDAFRRLLSNLREYRLFLPDALLMRDRKDDDTRRDSDDDLLLISAPGHDRPSTQLAICFTDIQASTVLWESASSSMFDTLRQHNTVLRKVLAACSGYEVKTIGDSFMVAFADVLNACHFALDVQVRLVDAEWPPPLLLHDLCKRVDGKAGERLWGGPRVRVGLHWGEAQVEWNPVTGRCDYFGTTVNTAARVEAALQHGGLSGVTEDMLDALGPAGLADLGGVRLHPLGPRLLVGIRDPVAITVILPLSLSGRVDVLKEPTPVAVDCGRSSASSRTSFLERSLSSSILTSASAAPFGRQPSNPTQVRSSMRKTVATTGTVRASLSSLSSLEIELRLLLAVTEHAASVTQAVLDTVVSGLTVVVWNGPQSCRDHVAQSLNFTCMLQTQVTHNVPHSVGLCSGHLLYGNIAAARRRYATVVGGCVEVCATLAEAAETMMVYSLAAGAVGKFAEFEGFVAGSYQWQAGCRMLQVWELVPRAFTGDDRWGMFCGRQSLHQEADDLDDPSPAVSVDRDQSVVQDPAACRQLPDVRGVIENMVEE